MKKSIFMSMLASATLVGACEPDPGAVLPGTYPQTSQMGISEDGNTLYIALADHDQVRAIDAATGEVIGKSDVTGAPHRLTVLKDGRVAVSARYAGTVSVLERDASAVVSTVEVGAEPFGLVEADGNIVVALAGQNELARIPVADTSRVVDRVALNAPEPRGLAVDANGRLLVTHFKGGTISTVNLGQGVVDHEIQMKMAANPHFEANQLDTITTAPDGDEIVVPHEECNNDPTQFGEGGSEFGGDTVAYYASGPTGHPAVIPTVSRVDTGLGVHLSDGPGPFDLNFPEGKPEKGGAVAAVINPHDAYMTQGQRVNTPVAVALADGGNLELVVNRGSGNVFIRKSRIEPGETSLVSVVDVGVGASSIVLSPDGKTAHVFNEFTYEVTSFAVPKVEVAGPENTMSLDRHRDRDRWDPTGSRGLLEIDDVTHRKIADDVLTAEVIRGRQLFHSVSSQMTRGGAVSCASCHPGGADDGTTWQFAQGQRQTPPLWGRLSETMPYHWDQTLVDMSAINNFTVMMRMGGEGLDGRDVVALQAFIDTIPAPAIPMNADFASSERGREIFFSQQANCASCHSGSHFTDNNAHNVDTGVGRSANETMNSFATPQLLGIGRSAPYMHDGSAATLEDLVNQYVATDRMGRGSHLTEQDKADLVSFLKTL